MKFTDWYHADINQDKQAKIAIYVLHFVWLPYTSDTIVLNTSSAVIFACVDKSS